MPFSLYIGIVLLDLFILYLPLPLILIIWPLIIIITTHSYTHLLHLALSYFLSLKSLLSSCNWSPLLSLSFFLSLSHSHSLTFFSWCIHLKIFSGNAEVSWIKKFENHLQKPNITWCRICHTAPSYHSAPRYNVPLILHLGTMYPSYCT